HFLSLLPSLSEASKRRPFRPVFQEEGGGRIVGLGAGSVPGGKPATGYGYITGGRRSHGSFSCATGHGCPDPEFIMRNTIRPILFFLAVGVLSGLGACKSEAAGAEPQVVPATDLLELIGTDAAPLILDVRTPEEYAAGHVPGAINIPHDQMATRVD